MQIDLMYRYTQGYLPTRRHRRPRTRNVIAPISVHITELSSPSDFLVAFITHRYTSVQEGATCWQDFDGSSDFRMWNSKTEARLAEELRVFLWCRCQYRIHVIHRLFPVPKQSRITRAFV